MKLNLSTISNNSDIRNMLSGYLACALWLSPADEEGNESPCDDRNIFELDHENVVSVALPSVTEFYEKWGTLLNEHFDNYSIAYSPDGGDVWSLVGHDLYLTESGSGSGFYDREDYYSSLSKMMHENVARHEIWAYIGDDGKVWLAG